MLSPCFAYILLKDQMNEACILILRRIGKLPEAQAVAESN